MGSISFGVLVESLICSSLGVQPVLETTQVTRHEGLVQPRPLYRWPIGVEAVAGKGTYIVPCPRDVHLRDLTWLAWLSSKCTWPCAGKRPHGLCHPDLLSSRRICGSSRQPGAWVCLWQGPPVGSMFRETPYCWLEAAQLDSRAVSVLLLLIFAWPCQRSSCRQEAVGTPPSPVPVHAASLDVVGGTRVSICTAVECNVDVMAPASSCALCGAWHGSPGPS